MSYRRYRVLALAATMLAAPTYAFAQDAQTGASESTEDGIVVTARKRSESLLDVPISITAFSEKSLEVQGIQSVSDFQNSIPNLQYSARGDLNNQINIRGVGGDARNVGTESGVGLYIDGVFAGRTGAYNQDLANIERVEVLRGPQGTLFGKNTTGGVINIITARPGPDLKADIYGSYGNYDAYIIKASVSGQIAENFYAGATFAANTRDGLVFNAFDRTRLDDINRRGGRLQLLWNPSDALNFYWVADRTTNTVDFALTKTAAPFTGNAAGFGSVNSRLVASQNANNNQEADTTGLSQTIEYGFDSGLSLTAISAYRKTDIEIFSDSDSTGNEIVSAGPFTDNSELFSQELRLTSPDEGPIRYVLGGYYFNQNAFAYRELRFGGSLANGYLTRSEVDTEAWAAFGNVDVKLSDALTLTGGLRYTTELKTGSQFQLSAGRNYNIRDLRRRDEDLSSTASLNYRVTPDVSFYVTASRGFKSGGFNVEPISVANLPSSALNYAPEKLTNYEIGSKGQLLGGALTYSSAFFYMQFDNKQVSQFLGSGFPIIQIGNAGEATIKGFEIEGTARLSEIVTINAGVSHLDTEYTAFPNAASVGGVVLDYTGNKLENAPSWSADGALNLRVPAGNGFVIARGAVRYTGGTHFQPDNLAINFQKEYTLVNGRIGYESGDGKTTAALWGKNLTDETYYTFSRVTIGIHQVLYGEPRTYGIELSRKF